MKIIDKKRMVYSFYLEEGSFEHRINKLHFRLLERYINKFDEVIFCIIVDDKENKSLIKKLQLKIINMYPGNITFKIYDNTNYRETYVFYHEIATKMDTLDGLTFFGHNKGISDVDPIETIEEWVASMYYFNLEHELPCKGLNGFLFYGALKSADINIYFHNIDVLGTKYKWCYCGTFYWGKYQDVYKALKRKGEEIPQLTNRWYDEMFPGELFPQNYGLTYEAFYMPNEMVYQGNIDEYIKGTYCYHPQIYYDFKKWYEELMSVPYEE